MDSSPAEGDLEILVDGKWHMIQQCAQSAKRDNYTLGCTRASTSSCSEKALSHSALCWCSLTSRWHAKESYKDG